MEAKERRKVWGVMVQDRLSSGLFFFKYFQTAMRDILVHLSLLGSDLAFLVM